MGWFNHQLVFFVGGVESGIFNDTSLENTMMTPVQQSPSGVEFAKSDGRAISPPECSGKSMASK